MTMKKSLVIAMGILALGAIPPIFQRRQLVGLEDRHRALIAEAAALGVSDHSPLRTLSRQKRESQMQAMEVRWAAASKRLDLYEKTGQQLDPYGEHFEGFLSGLSAMENSQLLWLIAKIREDKEMSHHSRSLILITCIRQISELQPALALALYDECADLIEQNDQTQHTLTQALCNLATSDASAVAEWLRKNGENYSNHADENSRSEVIGSVAISDPALAFKIMESQQFPPPFWGPLDAIIGTVEDSPERRDPVLAALRHHLAGLPSDAVSEKIHNAAFATFAAKLGDDPYDSASGWISRSAFSAAEKAHFASGLSYRGTQENTGHWIEWMAVNVTGDSLAGPVKQLVGQWTRQDYQAAGAWLEVTPDCPAKHLAVQTFAATVAPYDPQVAGQWAITLPPGSVGDETFKVVYQNWPGDDPIGAAAFAREHGLE